MNGIKIRGTGRGVPSKVVTNADMAKIVETNDEWIVSRTGISSRRHCSGEECHTSLALSAARQALDRAGISPEEIDRVLVAGQFGKHLAPESLTGCDIIPASLLQRISYIGNSSMTGAQLCLLSGEERLRAWKIAREISYIELSVTPGYEKRFTQCLQFREG